MYDLDPRDPRLDTLEGGYRILFDPRPLIVELEKNPQDQRLWNELIENVYHQGDVGPASYASICLLSQSANVTAALPWQCVALAGWVALARGSAGNPPLPSWMAGSFHQAIEALALGSLRKLPQSSAAQAPLLLGLIAFWKGLPQHAAILLETSEEEAAHLRAGTYFA